MSVKDNISTSRELELWCNTVFNYTKEMAENPTSATKWIFDRATHDEWSLKCFPKRFASKRAYNEFFELTGKDIRNFNWTSSVKTKSGEKVVVHKLFVEEHLTTAYDFKNTLLFYYKSGVLTTDVIKELLFKQRICWITKEENSRLNSKGYRTHRDSPLDAYKECGIEIYDEVNQNLDVMRPDFGGGNNAKVSSREEFFKKLSDYFENNLVLGSSYKIQHVEGNEYAHIYNSAGNCIDVRVKGGFLNDICLYLGGDNAKKMFDILYINKDDFEKTLGYRLVWDRNNNRKACRIGRFGIFSPSPNIYGITSEEDEILEDVIKPFDFDKDVERVATELVRFYKLFVPWITVVKGALKENN